MKKSLFAVVAFLLVCTSIGYTQDEIDSISSYTSYNQYDFDFVGGGARSKGMGNAFLGVSNDITSGSWNPAGLFEMDKTIIAFSWFKLAPKGVSTTQTFSDLVESDHVGSFSNISAVNFVYPIRISGHPFVFTGNLTRNFNTFSQFKFKTESILYDTTASLDAIFYDTNTVNQSISAGQQGGMNSLNVGFGTRLYNNISFGVTVNIYSGSSIYKVDRQTQIKDLRYLVYQPAIFDSKEFVEDTNKFSGANFTLGFMRNSDKLDVGLVIRTPFNLKERRIQSIYVNSFISEDENSDKSPIAHYGVFLTDILFQYEMPLMVGLGAGYKVNENWLLAGDIEYRGFSGKKINYRVSQTINPGGNNIEDYIVLDPMWENSVSVRLGSEYMKSFSFGKVPLRAGFGYVPLPQSSVTEIPGASTVVNYNFTAGTGIHFEQIQFDVAYVYSTANLEVGGFDGEVDLKNHTITASFTGTF